MTGENGNEACSNSEVMALPWQSWTTTPRPALPNSRKMAPLKFSLRQFAGGGCHWTWCWGRVITVWLMRECWLYWKVSRACKACWRICALGKTLVLTRSWFRWCHIVHITIAMRSTFLLFLWVKLISSLVFEASSCLRYSKPGMVSYISSNVVHSHSAWAIVSDSTPHCSHLSSIRIFLLNRLCLAGMASLQTRHMKFSTLLGMLSS